MSRLRQSADPLLQVYEWTHNLCKRIARQGWDIRRYNDGDPWDDDAILGLCHEVIERLKEGDSARLKAILDSAEDDSQIRKQLSYEVRNALQRREKNQPFNNLIKRIRRLAKEGHFEIIRIKGVGDVVTKPGSNATYRALSSAEIRSSALKCEELPVIYSSRQHSVMVDSHGHQRRQQSSPMYMTEHLIVAIDRILETSGTVTTFELREIFEFLLTPWSRNLDVPFEESSTGEDDDYDFGSYDPDDSNLPHDRTMHQQLTSLEHELPNSAALINELTEHDVFLLLCLGSGITFVAISDHKGITRQTIATHSRRVQTKLEAALLADQHYSASAAAAVRQLLIDRLAAHFAADLTMEESKLWVYATQEAQSSINELVIENALDLSECEARLKAMFRDRILFALQHDSPDRSHYEQVEALRATQNACAERIPQ